MQRDWRRARRSIARDTCASGSVMAKASPEAGARGAVLQPHVDADMLLREPARPDAVDEHPLAVRGLERLVTRLTPGSGTVETLDSPALPSPKEGASR